MLSRMAIALNATDTRDSITEVLQYSVKLCSGIFSGNELVYRRLYKSLSEGRKIFRLFRFIPEMSNLAHMDDPDSLLLGICRFQSCVSVVFYVLDNLVYVLEIVKRKSRREIRPLKYIKNRVALLRIWIGIILALFLIKRRKSGLGQHVFRLWHESLRLWLTLHKLHMMSLFYSLNTKSALVPVHRRSTIPGIVGLVSAITALIRKSAKG